MPSNPSLQSTPIWLSTDQPGWGGCPGEFGWGGSRFHPRIDQTLPFDPQPRLFFNFFLSSKLESSLRSSRRRIHMTLINKSSLRLNLLFPYPATKISRIIFGCTLFLIICLIIFFWIFLIIFLHKSTRARPRVIDVLDHVNRITRISKVNHASSVYCTLLYTTRILQLFINLVLSTRRQNFKKIYCFFAQSDPSLFTSVHACKSPVYNLGSVYAGWSPLSLFLHKDKRRTSKLEVLQPAPQVLFILHPNEHLRYIHHSNRVRAQVLRMAWTAALSQAWEVTEE